MSCKLIGWALALSALFQIAAQADAFEATKQAGSLDRQWESIQARYEPVKQRQQQIAEANAAEVHPPAWAGIYYLGDGMGQNLLVALSDTAGAAVILQGDIGTYGASTGSVEPLPNGHLAIRLEHPMWGFEGQEYVPIGWAGRMYLVESGQLAHFASDINLGLEPRKARQGSYLLREGDEKLPVTGLPALPAAEAALIRNKPLLVRVTSVRLLKSRTLKYGCVRSYRVDIDHGAADGLARGAVLDSVNETERKSIGLTEVQPAQASASYDDVLSACDRPGKVPLRGELYTTGSYPRASRL